MMMRSALSVTNALVAPRWMYGRAAGATSAKACTCAITSCRKRRSYAADRVEVDVVDVLTASA